MTIAVSPVEKLAAIGRLPRIHTILDQEDQGKMLVRA
jgi:hypothetical protein